MWTKALWARTSRGKSAGDPDQIATHGGGWASWDIICSASTSDERASGWQRRSRWHSLAGCRELMPHEAKGQLGQSHPGAVVLGRRVRVGREHAHLVSRLTQVANQALKPTA